MFPMESAIETAKRRQMVELQLRQRGICDQKLLDIMEQLPRHHFIPYPNQSDAYLDQPVPIGFGQTISQPYIVGLMTEKLDVEPDHEVLEIGTGCGYQTAILAKLCRWVYSVEIVEQLAQLGRENVTALDITNVQYHIGDAWQGWPEHKQFDRIMVAAAAEEVPPVLLEQLKDHGKMVIPVGEQFGQKLLLLGKHGQKISKQNLCYCRFVKLVHK